MKTYIQFCEDLQQRRTQLAKRQRENVSAFKKRVAAKSSSFKERLAKRKEREDLKREIKRELQTEQTPHMNPTPFNIMKAREQAKGGIQHRKHVHGEIARETSAQQSAKRARMKEILSR